MNNLAEVWLWGQRVGVLAAVPGSMAFAFEYDDGWLSSGVSVSPLHLPLRRQVFQFPSLPAETFKHLPGVFADALPDDFGNAVINAWLAHEGRDADQFHALDRLLYTGSRGMGAMEYHPAMHRGSRNGNRYDLQVPSLMEMAQQVLDERARLALGQFTPDDHQRKA